MPAVAAVELGRHCLTLHLNAPAQLSPPWTDLGNETRWSLPSGTDPEVLGDLIPDQVAPYPLLVTIGTSDTGNVWLLNCEDLTITLTGDPTYRDDFARYLTAEVACNPWSASVTLNCVGVATQVAPLNPDRIRYFKDQGAPVDSFAVGSHISGATPIDFTGDIKEIDGRPIAKRGRIPGRTESPRLKRLDLAAWRET